MDVEVEELDLGVGDLRQRLPVHAHELQERDQRQPGVQHRAEAAQQLEVVLAEVLQRRRREPGRASRCAGSARARARSRAAASASACSTVRAPGTGPPGSRRRAAPPWPRRAAASSECPRARSRATIRAWASAAGVHSPSRSGTIPSATQRRRVAGETSSARATSVSECGHARPARSDLQVRLLALDVVAVLVVDRLGDRDQRRARP